MCLYRKGGPKRKSKRQFINMATTYNFTESLSRIDDVLMAKIPEKATGGIPEVEDINPSAVYLPQATVVHVNFEIEQDMWQPVDEKYGLPVIQSFISEAMNIGGACECCKDIMIAENYLRFVYDTPLKKDLNEALDDAARIKTLALVVSKKAKQKRYPLIKASVGMDYGAVTLLPVNLHDYRLSRFVWMGEAIKKAEELAGKADDDIVISPIVWKNLTENNRKLFEAEYLLATFYRGKIVNIAMNNWVTK